jgi:epoxide hydrolase-like predicted phosphatase
VLANPTEQADVAILAVVFDIGGVLERIDDPDQVIGRKWRARLGLTEVDYAAAIGSVDPGQLNQVGQMSEAEYRLRCVAALGLRSEQADEFIADMWDWYCGELDAELHAFARSLRPGLRTSILSNSGDGARREEQARYGLEDDFDPIIYSHEVGLAKPDPAIFELTWTRIGVAPEEMIFVDDTQAHVDAASRLGIHAIRNAETQRTIEAVSELLAKL